MARYLSPEWLAELDRACRDGRRRKAPAIAETRFVIQQLVSDGPHGDVAYHLCIDHGEVSVHAGVAPAPAVTLNQDYDTAAAVARGELSAQRAFMAGRLRVRGDLLGLVELQGSIAELSDDIGGVRRALRDRTEF